MKSSIVIIFLRMRNKQYYRVVAIYW